MGIESDLRRQAVEARDRALRHGLPDTALVLGGIAAMIAALEAEGDGAPADAGPARPEPPPSGRTPPSGR